VALPWLLIVGVALLRYDVRNLFGSRLCVRRGLRQASDRAVPDRCVVDRVRQGVGDLETVKTE
jgi:hypothetical protein